MNKTTLISTMQTAMDGMREEWQKDQLVMALDGLTNSNVSDEDGSLAQAIGAFLELSQTERQSVVQFFRLRQQTLSWASTADPAEVASLIEALGGRSSSDTAGEE